MVHVFFATVLLSSFVATTAGASLMLSPEIHGAEENYRADEGDVIPTLTFGYSEEGRAIVGHVFGEGERVVFLLGGLHGNEKGASHLLQRFAREIHQDPSRLASDNQVVIVPIANPDGYLMRDDKLNANAVNLNRNFPTTDWIRFEHPDDPITFAGNEPFSEEESLVVKSIVETYQPDMLLSYHSQGAIISPEAGKASHDLADWYIERSGYGYYNEWDFGGTATKWFTQTTGNPALTIELTNHVDDDWEINKNALFELLADE